MEKITIPAEHLEEIKSLCAMGEMLEIEGEIHARRYKDLIAKYDKTGAYEEMLNGRRIKFESEKNHKDKWDAIALAVPQTKDGNWTLSIKDWTLRPSNKRGGLPNGLGAGMGAILGEMAARRMSEDDSED